MITDIIKCRVLSVKRIEINPKYPMTLPGKKYSFISYFMLAWIIKQSIEYVQVDTSSVLSHSVPALFCLSSED